jgi:hypothetical protein
LFGRKFVSFVRSFNFLLAVLVLASAAAAQTQVQGLITGHSGATMMVKTKDGETVVVALTPETQVDEVQGSTSAEKRWLHGTDSGSAGAGQLIP